MKRLVHLFVLAATLALPATGLAQGTITDGNANFQFSTMATTGTSDSNDAQIRPEGVLNHGFEQWWWFRLAGGTRETPFNSAMAGFSQSYVGNTATLTFNQPGVFDGTMTYVITDGGVAGEASVVTTMRIVNTSGVDLPISLFNYLDLDMHASAGGDSAVLENANPRMRITDGATPSPFAMYDGTGATFYRAGAFATAELGLNNTVVDNFANDGLPFGPGDWAGGFQWDVTIAAAGNFNATATISIESLAVVPEPTTMALAGAGLAGVVVTYRKRRRRVVRKAC